MVDDVHPKFLIEAMLLSVPGPLSEQEIVERLQHRIDIRPIMDDLQRDYQDRAIMLVETSEGRWAVRTRPEHSALASHFLPKPPRVSRAAIDTLYIIAYFQPVTRGEIERIRGVSSSRDMIDVLIFNGWVKPGPRRSTPGNPMTFLTTEIFLETFNFQSLNDLPNIEQMRQEGLLNRDIGIDLPSRTEASDADEGDL